MMHDCENVSKSANKIIIFNDFWIEKLSSLEHKENMM
jgi:hypothetical protein